MTNTPNTSARTTNATETGTQARRRSRLRLGMSALSLTVVASSMIGTASALPGDPIDPNEPEVTVPTTLPPFSAAADGFTVRASARMGAWKAAWSTTNNLYDPAYVSPAAFNMLFSGCRTQADYIASTSALPTVNRYKFTSGGATKYEGNSCTPSIPFSAQGTYPVTMQVTGPSGNAIGNFTKDVVVKDLLVVVIGDSMSSGEGSPDAPRNGDVAPKWVDKRCHRSASSGGVYAAQRIEEDPATSVTFLNFACSGATIDTDNGNDYHFPDWYETVGNDGTGLLGGYRGIETNATTLLPSQLQQIKSAVGNRPIDAIVMSIGINDAGFSKMMKTCIFYADCPNRMVGYNPEKQLQNRFKADVDRIPALYKRVADEMKNLGIVSRRTLALEYPSAFRDAAGNRCGAILESAAALNLLGPISAELMPPIFGWGPAEVQWAETGPQKWLNDAVRSGSDLAGFTYVSGITDKFNKHGICAGEGKRWINDEWTANSYTGLTGTMHPNSSGYWAIGDSVYAALTASSPIIARNDNYQTVASNMNVTADKGVLANDEVGNDVRTIPTVSLFSPPSAGTLKLNSDGSFSFTAPGTGNFSFRYKLTNGTAIVVGTVKIAVSNPHGGPR